MGRLKHSKNKTLIQVLEKSKEIIDHAWTFINSDRPSWTFINSDRPWQYLYNKSKEKELISKTRKQITLLLYRWKRQEKENEKKKHSI